MIVGGGLRLPSAHSTIAIGLIFDMLIVRLFLVMPLARLLGPWFWWPQRVRSRPGLNRPARQQFSSNGLSTESTILPTWIVRAPGRDTAWSHRKCLYCNRNAAPERFEKRSRHKKTSPITKTRRRP